MVTFMKTEQIRPFLTSMLACASLTGALAATYTLTDLGTGWATDVNAAGKVVGADPVTGGWYFDGTSRSTLQFSAYQLGTGPGSGPDFAIKNTLPTAISDNGRIVGICVLPGPPPPNNLYGFFYDVGGSGTVMSPSSLFYPYGVNSGGVVVGSHSYFDGTNVVSLPGNSTPNFLTTARAVNDTGLIVGSIGPDNNGLIQAVQFSEGTNLLLNLGDVGTFFGSRTLSEALSVNSAGQVVGYVKDGSSAPFAKAYTPFLYAYGSATNLGGLGGNMASANDINNNGLIVGTSTVVDGSFHAFVFVSGGMVDLNSVISSGGSGWVVTSANAVNDSGVIVGEGLKNGTQHSFMLTPVTDNLPPAVNLPPVGTNLFVGQAFTLEVKAAGSGTLTYQWQHAGTNIPSATNAIYTVASATANDDGSYLVQVSNAFGTTPSSSVTVRVKVLAEIERALYAGIKVTGPIGQTFRIEAVEQVGGTDWQSLGNVTLSTKTFFWVDTDSPQHPHRFYRAVPLP